jgi:hypothetical protein
MSSSTLSMVNAIGDATNAADQDKENAVPETEAGVNTTEETAQKEPFSPAEIDILKQYVEDFKKLDRAGRVTLLKKQALPALRALNLHLNQDKWNLRKAVSLDTSFARGLSIDGLCSR